jgi:hypothetical protein
MPPGTRPDARLHRPPSPGADPTLFCASLMVSVTVRLIPGSVIDLMLQIPSKSADEMRAVFKDNLVIVKIRAHQRLGASAR